MQKDPSWGASFHVLRYPEILIDRDAVLGRRVITCIRCQDLGSPSQRAKSACKVVAGGVGHTFVKIAILAPMDGGYDYDVKILGH